MGDKKNVTYRGNKSYLPTKPCVVCGRPMTWRKAWAEDWDSVRYCSAACRQEWKRTGRSLRTDRPDD